MCLDGTNYQQWASTMQSYLMSQGQWKCVKPSATTPTLKTEDGGNTTQEDIDAWHEDEEKALGNIHLCLHFTIGAQYSEYELPATLWATLKEKYGSPGLSSAFIKFKATMDTVIPNGSDPNPTIDKILSHFTRLEHMKWDIPEKIRAMILLAKAPISMDSLIQIIAQGVQEDDKKLKLDIVVKTMSLSWETHRCTGTQRASGSGQNQQ